MPDRSRPAFTPIASPDILFVGDTHFRSARIAGEPERRSRFLGFLENVPADSTLFLIGDIFDFYFEYRSVVCSRYLDLLHGIRRCVERGTDVRFIGGNHDYWVGRYFRDELGVKIEGDEVCFSAQGRNVVCSHGDLVMPGDHGYKVLKTVIRNRAVIAVARWLHPDLMDRLAGGVSDGSRAVRQHDQRARAARVTEWAHRQFYDRGNDIYVMGHVHHAVHDVRGAREFIIVGDWFDVPRYARLSGGQLTLETFTE